MPPLFTTTRQRPAYPSIIDGKQVLRDPIAVNEKGKAPVADGLLSDEQDVIGVSVKNVRGTGVTLIKTEAIDAYARPQIPVIQATVLHAYSGIHIDSSCPDAELLLPRVAGVRDVGVWLESGNDTILGGHSYGADISLRVGGNVNSGGGLIVGFTFSDARVCGSIETNGVQIVGCFSQNGFERNLYVLVQCSLTNVRVNVRPADKEWPSPVGIHFTMKANWSTDIGGMMWVPTGSIGVFLDNADGCTIQRKITCGPDAVALRMNGGSMNAGAIDVVGLDPEHPAIVEINALGTDNDLKFRGTNYVVKLPASVHPSNTIDVRGAK